MQITVANTNLDDLLVGVAQPAGGRGVCRVAAGLHLLDALGLRGAVGFQDLQSLLGCLRLSGITSWYQ